MIYDCVPRWLKVSWGSLKIPNVGPSRFIYKTGFLSCAPQTYLLCVRALPSWSGPTWGSSTAHLTCTPIWRRQCHTLARGLKAGRGSEGTRPLSLRSGAHVHCERGLSPPTPPRHPPLPCAVLHNLCISSPSAFVRLKLRNIVRHSWGLSGRRPRSVKRGKTQCESADGNINMVNTDFMDQYESFCLISGCTTTGNNRK